MKASSTLKIIHDDVAPLVERNETLTAGQRRRLELAACFWRARSQAETKLMTNRHLLAELEAAIASCITDRLVA